MGLFDTIVIDERRYQTKALGAFGNTFALGDPARVAYKAETEEEYALGRVHRYDELPTSYTVEAVAEGVGELAVINVEICDGRIAGTASDPRAAHFDRRGRSIGRVRYEPVIERNEDWIQQKRDASVAIAQIVARRHDRPRPV